MHMDRYSAVSNDMCDDIQVIQWSNILYSVCVYRWFIPNNVEEPSLWFLFISIKIGYITSAVCPHVYK